MPKNLQIIRNAFLIVISILLQFKSNAQTVGVVLSGGGATGMAHVGFLKALEENNIPIDFIVGTSAGALVASLYASGYSPNEIDSILISEKFLLMIQGEIEGDYKFFFNKEYEDASVVKIDFSKEFKSESFLPTNFIFPNLLDFELLKLLNEYPIKNQNFDSLFIPFRCVAADVKKNKPIVLKNGNINQAVRASMTYPFYLKPIKINGNYMYDGGIYNNFPSDILYQDFLPDVIIGCNLSDSTESAQDDLISQLESLILNRSYNDINCETGIVIKPKTKVGSFDFANSPQALKDGYVATLKSMDSIKSLVSKRVPYSLINQKRTKYKANHKYEIYIDSVLVNNTDKQSDKKALFISKSLLKNDEKISLDELKKNYFRLVSDPTIQYIFPKIKKNQLTDNYILELDVSYNKEFSASFGGIYSSSPINAGFIGINYRFLRKTSHQITANSYFGKLYGSIYGDYRINFPKSKHPIAFSFGGSINRWDYFRSFATFFEEVKPSFIVINEYNSFLKFHYAINNKTNLDFSYNNFFYLNNYYQTDVFSLSDTTDLDRFYGHNLKLNIVKNTQNEKLYPTSGTLYKISLDGVLGEETFIPGSTSILKDIIQQNQNWLKLKFTFDKYYNINPKLTLGTYLNTTVSSKFAFSNYFSTLLYSSQFEPIEQMRVMYTENFRSNNYIAIGLKQIYSIKPRIQIRNEVYLYSEIFDIRNGNNNQPITLSRSFLSYFPIIKSSLIFTSPIGPLGISASYLYPEKKPLIIQLNFGYIIQNKKILE